MIGASFVVGVFLGAGSWLLGASVVVMMRLMVLGALLYGLVLSVALHELLEVALEREWEFVVQSSIALGLGVLLVIAARLKVKEARS